MAAGTGGCGKASTSREGGRRETKARDESSRGSRRNGVATERSAGVGGAAEGGECGVVKREEEVVPSDDLEVSSFVRSQQLRELRTEYEPPISRYVQIANVSHNNIHEHRPASPLLLLR